MNIKKTSEFLPRLKYIDPDRILKCKKLLLVIKWTPENLTGLVFIDKKLLPP